MVIDSRRTSRVVPAISVTIARSSPARRFNSEDLPTLGAPTITTCTPSSKRLPRSACSSKVCISCCTPCNLCCSSGAARKSISSSGKSRAASIYTRRFTRPCSTSCTRLENSPSSDLRAALAAASLPAEIKSATASACAKSSFSFKNARSVNSPGRACRAPRVMQRFCNCIKT